MQRTTLIVFTGDLVVLAGVTLYGFQSHGTLITAGSRILATYLPLVAAWLMVAPLLGAYERTRMADLRQVWRPFYAMILAAPMAAFLRGIINNAPILPVFVLVVGGFSALALLGWRAIVAWYLRRRET
jgi:hypothetical protein